MAAEDLAQPGQDPAPEQREHLPCFPSAALQDGVAEGAVLPGLGEGAADGGGGGWGASTRPPASTGLRVRHLRNMSQCSSCSIESAGGASCPDPPGTQPAEPGGSCRGRGRAARGVARVRCCDASPLCCWRGGCPLAR